MKTMTCEQLGGPCDLALRADSADEEIKLQDQHLKDAVANGDDSHADALKDMKGRWKRPVSGMKWYKATKRESAAPPGEWAGGSPVRRLGAEPLHPGADG